MSRPALASIVLENGDKIVVLDWAGQSSTFCNLQRIDAAGTVVWTAVPQHALEAVWTGLRVDEAGRLHANNYAGFDDVIDWETGRILERVFVK